MTGQVTRGVGSVGRSVALAGLLFVGNVHAQPLVNIETVTVGDPGNAADNTGYGAVAYEFNIGKYEVTIGQYATFLNSVASVTEENYIIDLWSSGMQADLNVAGISRSGAGTLANPYVYAEIAPFGVTPVGASSAGNRPISYVSWFDAARFVNWIHNGATNGASTETGAYILNGATNGIVLRESHASWWIPSEDEWYKAGYCKGGGTNSGYWKYPTQSDSAPGNIIGDQPNQANILTYSGVQGDPFEIQWTFAVTQSASALPGPSQNYLTDVGAFTASGSAYGTFDQGGNVYEWNDAVFGDDARGLRGGDWNFDEITADSSYGNVQAADYENSSIGFRLATVPEPSTYALLLITSAATLWHLRRRR